MVFHSYVSLPEGNPFSDKPIVFHCRGALLGGLFASWVRTLESDASVGAERGKRRPPEVSSVTGRHGGSPSHLSHHGFQMVSVENG